MELIKQAISNHSRLIPGIEGYLTLVDKIERNQSINPDIAIEACKSLIEGLCLKALSLLSDKYNSSKSVRSNCKNNLTTLTNMAFDEVYSNYVESQIHESLANMLIDISVAQKIKDNAKRKVKEQTVKTIGQVSAIRNERGDISHGRNYPKDQESSIKLAKSISSITDGIGSFMIEEVAIQYLAKLKEQEKLIYTDLEEFNEWLDEQHHVLSIKIDFSKLLYDNAYEKYEEFYFTEYMELVEVDETDTEAAAEVEVSDTEEPTEPIPVLVEEVETEEQEDLVGDFNEAEFWSPEKDERLKAFSEAENLDDEGLKEIINEFLFTDKKPLRDDVVDIMRIKPSLRDRANVATEMTEKIVAFTDELNVNETEQ